MTDEAINETVRRIHGVPDGWRWFRLDCHNKPEDYWEVEGSVPVGFYRRGPRKGRPKWDRKTSQTFWVRKSQVAETHRMDSK
jgi:hypothetical protein